MWTNAEGLGSGSPEQPLDGHGLVLVMLQKGFAWELFTVVTSKLSFSSYPTLYKHGIELCKLRP